MQWVGPGEFFVTQRWGFTLVPSPESYRVPPLPPTLISLKLVPQEPSPGRQILSMVLNWDLSISANEGWS